ncbi:hypothetical protein [Microbacterium sp. CIAB417]|uniref:hypothetical protein n=1 Tax=Microbacterium sp. CIAB417 TaxID=2860287 RepID=UPI001FAD671C|nr:hypothetical protein [Microbacterium sp. CIAB417]
MRGAVSERAFAVASTLALTAMLVSGCTGDGEAGAFAAEFAGDPAVASVELTSHDNQPFTGGVSGQVVAREGVADHEVSALADRLSSYTRENGERMRGLVSLLADMPLAGMRLRDDALVMTLAKEEDYARAADRAATLTSDGEPRLAFASDLIRLGETDGALTRDLVERLDDPELECIAYVWESGSRLQIAVTSQRYLDAVARSVTAALPEGTTHAWVVVDGDPESRVDLVVP